MHAMVARSPGSRCEMRASLKREPPDTTRRNGGTEVRHKKARRGRDADMEADVRGEDRSLKEKGPAPEQRGVGVDVLACKRHSASDPSSGRQDRISKQVLQTRQKSSKMKKTEALQLEQPFDDIACSRNTCQNVIEDTSRRRFGSVSNNLDVPDPGPSEDRASHQHGLELNVADSIQVLIPSGISARDADTTAHVAGLPADCLSPNVREVDYGDVLASGQEATEAQQNQRGTRTQSTLHSSTKDIHEALPYQAQPAVGPGDERPGAEPVAVPPARSLTGPQAAASEMPPPTSCGEASALTANERRLRVLRERLLQVRRGQPASVTTGGALASASSAEAAATSNSGQASTTTTQLPLQGLPVSSGAGSVISVFEQQPAMSQSAVHTRPTSLRSAAVTVPVVTPRQLKAASRVMLRGKRESELRAMALQALDRARPAERPPGSLAMRALPPLPVE